MKAILEFNLPKDQEEHNAALRGMSYRCALDNMDNYLRSKIKYDNDLTDEVKNALQEVRDELNKEIQDANQ